MDKQAREAREQMKALSKKDKWTNFWYYYRTHVIVGIFVIFLIGYTAVECAKRVNYDLTISYYSTTPISQEGTGKLTEELVKIVDDINYNGQVDVYIAPCFANLNEQNEQTQAVLMKLQAELAGGDSMGYIVDETYYNMLNKGYEECFEEFILISEIPSIREMLGIPEDTKVYWAVKKLYEAEKDDGYSGSASQIHEAQR